MSHLVLCYEMARNFFPEFYNTFFCVNLENKHNKPEAEADNSGLSIKNTKSSFTVTKKNMFVINMLTSWMILMIKYDILAENDCFQDQQISIRTI